MPRATINTDIAIIGGGIAGLWLLNRLHSAGYHAVLLESGTLGGGQTIASQGIIHSGAKYTLTGSLTAASQAIAAMPSIWQSCLNGMGEIDLRTAKILSKHQYLWSPGGLASKITAFFASKLARSRVTSLAPTEYPAIFQQPDFHGHVYQLQEIVLDIPSLLLALSTPCSDFLLQTTSNGCQPIYSPTGHITHCEMTSPTGETTQLHAQRYIFTAGIGNEAFLQTKLKMQRRPLHMVMAKHQVNAPVYAHCMENSPKPRITITTHLTADGHTVWYLGGQLAESGINKTPMEQCLAAKAELTTLFPWLDFSTAQWSTLYIDRAEPYQSNNQLPDGVYARDIDNNAIIAWPTKLALAPQLAKEILELLKRAGVNPVNPSIGFRALNPTYINWPRPKLAQAVWDQQQEWLSLP